MEDKIFDFAKTRDALSQLSADLLEFESAVKAKQSFLEAERQSRKKELEDKEQKIAGLRKAAEDALAEVQNINSYIEEAL